MHHKRFRNILVMILILCLSFLATGCWNRREIEDLGFVLAAGIDSSKQGYLLTVQAANVPALSKEGKNVPTFFTYTSTGETLFDAIRKTTHTSPKRLFWSHTKVLIINEEAAQRGIRPYLEYFGRDVEERRDFLLAVTPHRTVDLLKTNVVTDIIPALSINNLLEGYKATSTSIKVNLNDFLRVYHGSASALLPIVRLVQDQGSKQGFYVSGSAVFKKDKLAGQLSPIETRGFLWIKGEVKSGIIVTKCPNTEGKTVKEKLSFETFQADSEIKAEKNQGKFVIRVSIKESGNLAESACVKDEIDPSSLVELEKLKKEKIEAEVKAALEKTQKDLQADVFGFGEVIHRAYPKEWKNLKEYWDRVFPTLEVHVDVKTKITGTALIQRQKMKDKQ
ncbi:hypothetical protein BBR01nite_38460 [Brevibacillus brevis]|nr:hypothetical protein BBR01nite_38460 [Brevibacillus brevis]